MPATSSTTAYLMGSNTCKIRSTHSLKFLYNLPENMSNPIPRRTLLDLEEELIEKVRRKREVGGRRKLEAEIEKREGEC